MEQKHALTAKSICGIISECRKSGVSTFVLGNLRIEFNQYSEPPKPMELVVQRQEELLPVREKARLQKEKFEDLLEEARLADPALYEQLLENEDLDARSD
jgi:hypothetical protein